MKRWTLVRASEREIENAREKERKTKREGEKKQTKCFKQPLLRISRAHSNNFIPPKLKFSESAREVSSLVCDRGYRGKHEDPIFPTENRECSYQAWMYAIYIYIVNTYSSPDWNTCALYEPVVARLSGREKERRETREIDVSEKGMIDKHCQWLE